MCETIKTVSHQSQDRHRFQIARKEMARQVNKHVGSVRAGVCAKKKIIIIKKELAKSTLQIWHRPLSTLTKLFHCA